MPHPAEQARISDAEAAVIIGPSGNGKTTLGTALAKRLGWRFIEGDDHHPAGNIRKMARGEPLTDADRAPFFDSIARAMAGGSGAVVACSALKRAYRDRLLRQAGRPILFVLPLVTRAELARRLQSRKGHFMPPALLASQITTFEAPAPDEPVIEVDGVADPEVAVARIMAALGR